MNEWKHKDEWRKNGKGFCVVVSRHEVTLDMSGSSPDKGIHRWCIYAYIYPTHPHFKLFDVEKGMFEQPDYRMHWGLSFFHAHRNDKSEICSIQIGCDYDHLHDDHYTTLATKEAAVSVFNDADDLYAQLEQEKQ